MDIENTTDIPAPGKPDSELVDLVMELPKNWRISIYLHYYEGYPVREIAQMMGKSENTVSAYLAKGRKRLRSLMEQGDVPESTFRSRLKEG